MYSKVCILVDSFKSSISSIEIGKLGSSILHDLDNSLDVSYYSVADGGEGTVDFFINQMGYFKKEVESVNAHLQNITTYYAYLDDVAVFDVANIVGFHVNNYLDIEHATTFGIGIVLKEIIKAGFKKIYLGLGGSITNDGGSGLIEALGAKFYYQNELVSLHQSGHKMVDKVDLEPVLRLLQGVNIFTISDVINPLLGEFGATNIYSRQKGAQDDDVNRLEEWMSMYAKLFAYDSNKPGCGAAGGIGFVIQAIGGVHNLGIDVILNELDIKNKIDSNTLLITGEGRLDLTSLSGKVVGRLVNIAKETNTFVVIICGSDCLHDDNLTVYPLHEIVPSNYKETVKSDLINCFKKIYNDFLKK